MENAVTHRNVVIHLKKLIPMKNKMHMENAVTHRNVVIHLKKLIPMKNKMHNVRSEKVW